ncbi:hypothetical protein [uncultured Sphingomonas sp.]|uniref:hypothetical protein n=1 Tax=uncultured Sphingomonas sp. TaxID=158754 RepID=UPI0035CC5E40
MSAAPISLDDLLDLTRLRCDVEELAPRRVVAEGDASWEAAILSTAHRLRRTVRIVDDPPSSDWTTPADAVPGRQAPTIVENNVADGPERCRKGMRP